MYNSRYPYRRIVAQMERNSELIEHTPQVLCPCADDQNRADPTHIPCRGTGRLPLTSHTRIVRAMVSKFQASLYQGEFGTALPGDILVSPLPRGPVLVSLFDLVRVPGWEHAEPFQGEVVTRQSGLAGEQRFLTYPAKAIDYAVSSAGAGLTEYQQGVDFSFQGHVITWLTPAPAGTPISVRYRPIWEYLVAELPQVRYERGSDIGQRVLCRRRDMLPEGFTQTALPGGVSGQGSVFA